MQKFTNFNQFWPYYLHEHRRRDTRSLHFAGSAFAIVFIVIGIVIDTRLLILAPLFGYGFAWISHFYIEKNRPATFKHPFWSLLADYKMFFLMCIGKLDEELHRHNVADVE